MRRAKSSKTAAPAPPQVLAPHEDPRFKGVNLGLTVGPDYFEKLRAAGCRYDPSAADRVVQFFARYLVHTKGTWAGRPMVLEPWQEYHTRNLFGWKRADGTRVFRTAYIEVPRKNGKSTWIAGLGIYLTSADREVGAEVYSAAADVQQAAIVFETAAGMVKASPELRTRFKVFRRAMVVHALAAAYKVLSADGDTKHGFNSHAILFDELHTQSNRDLWDVLTTSTGSRKQPMTLAITTAGYDRTSICWEMHEYARKVAEGIFTDGEFYPIIYGASQEDDWKSPATWAKANPNLGVSIDEKYLAEACQRAINNPAFENTFRRLHLDQWTSQETRWIPMKSWDATSGEVPHDRMAEHLAGVECYGGLDLASSIDIAALDLVFPRRMDTPAGTVTIFKNLPFFWIPEENIEERSRSGAPYAFWVRQGLIRTTPGNIIDFDFIVRDIGELMSRYRILEVAYDRWGAQKICTDLQKMKLPIVPFGQGYGSMSAPSKELIRLILGGQFHHGGHPVMRWMADNVIVHQDPAGNIKPDKSKSANKIDGIVATIMALDRAVRHEGSNGPSVYERRGLTQL
jgi:phage terminase large subunit-like protein